MKKSRLSGVRVNCLSHGTTRSEELETKFLVLLKKNWPLVLFLKKKKKKKAPYCKIASWTWKSQEAWLASKIKFWHFFPFSQRLRPAPAWEDWRAAAERGREAAQSQHRAQQNFLAQECAVDFFFSPPARNRARENSATDVFWGWKPIT